MNLHWIEANHVRITKDGKDVYLSHEEFDVVVHDVIQFRNKQKAEAIAKLREQAAEMGFDLVEHEDR